MLYSSLVHMHATTEIKVKIGMAMIKTTRLASSSWIAVGKKILWEAVIIAVAAALNL